MKKLLAALGFVLCAGIMAQAQDSQTHKTAAAKRLTDSMTVKLNLTSDQVPKVQAINESFAAKAASIRADGGDKREKMKKMKDAGQEQEKALKEVLTTEQYRQYTEHKKEIRSGAKDRFRKRRGQ